MGFTAAIFRRLYLLTPLVAAAIGFPTFVECRLSSTVLAVPESISYRNAVATIRLGLYMP